MDHIQQVRFCNILDSCHDTQIAYSHSHLLPLSLGSYWRKENSFKIDTRFFVSKNHAYKNVEAQIWLKFKKIVLNLLIAISISFPGSDEI